MSEKQKISAKFATLLAVIAGIPMWSSQAFAADQRSPVDEIEACRSIADPALRLPCLDRASERLLQAHKAGELTIIDGAQVREAQRNLFGFNGVTLPSFLGASAEREEISSIQTTLRRASRDGYGQWTFHLADGSEWKQIDNETPRIRDQSGVEVRIRRAAFGSYLMNVGDARAIRVKRQ
ncbi:hypothetical protein V8J38_08275 [Brevundimonas olei]|uniref:Uncharacterized protein n=1 Tax=Brevundimonas olei TaxID=657642 RepID=A0ABZ2IB50_9CAUL